MCEQMQFEFDSSKYAICINKYGTSVLEIANDPYPEKSNVVYPKIYKSVVFGMNDLSGLSVLSIADKCYRLLGISKFRLDLPNKQEVKSVILNTALLCSHIGNFSELSDFPKYPVKGFAH